MFYALIKPFLFALPPERAHQLAVRTGALLPGLGKITGITRESFFDQMHLKVGSLNWKFPVGLAAGLDKNAEALDFFEGQGFGAIECGTITLRPQKGNPKPRLFRYPQTKELRNALGFPNEGIEKILPRIKTFKGKAPLGINLGKNKDSTPDESISELTRLFDTTKQFGDYFVINVSSPNTPGLKALQDRGYLTELFHELSKIRTHDQDLYLKVSPDLELKKISELVHLAKEMKLTGIIATNTLPDAKRGIGGLSGPTLREKSRQIQKFILSEKEHLELISVGGITTPRDLWELWKDGGKSAQVYTAYVYQGPDLLKNFYDFLINFITQQEINLDDFFNLPLEERQYRLSQSTLF